ncbi:MAG: precorrin-2 dehydrogenase/sirohydrochlorin ferrochelatase family protein [Nitrososphaeria archaeon]
MALRKGLTGLMLEKFFKKKKIKINALLKGKFLAIAATNDKEFNLKVKEESKKLGIMCNVVDFQDSEVIFPAVFKKGDMIIAVSSSGNLPYFSEFFAHKIGQMIEPYLKVYPALKKVRKSLKNVDASKKKEIQKELLSKHFELLMSGKWELIEKRLMSF